MGDSGPRDWPHWGHRTSLVNIPGKAQGTVGIDTRIGEINSGPQRAHSGILGTGLTFWASNRVYGQVFLK